MFGWNNIRIKTLRVIFIIIVIILLLVSAFSFSILLYLYTFERVTLPVGLLYIFDLVPLPTGLLLSVDYTPLGLIWEGLLIISTNPNLRLTLDFLLIAPLTLAFMLSPIGLIMNLSGFSGYENLGEAIKGFKSRIWVKKEGKRKVIFIVTGSATIYVCLLFILLSGFYIIPQNIFLTMTLFLTIAIVIIISNRILRNTDK